MKKAWPWRDVAFSGFTVTLTNSRGGVVRGWGGEDSLFFSGCQDVEILKMVEKKTSLSNMNEALSYDGENFQEYFEGEEFTIGLHLKFI